MVDQNSQFYAILTKVGAAKQANADALGIPWKITHMAVGDANLTDPMPDANWTSLLNEWRRAPLSQLKVDDKDNAIIIAEQVIPAEVGGRWIREVALFDEDGDMVAVANCAPTYKPLLSQGSGRTQVVRMNLVVSSSSNVQLKIDPSVVLATREFVTEELAKQDFKHSVLVATTGPIVLSGLQTIDTVVLPAGAAVLVKDQVAAKDNGLYVVAAGSWTRRADADTSAKVTSGLLVHVEKGAINGDGVWQLVTDGPINLGVSALAFEMAFGRTGVAAGTYRSVTVDKYGRVVAATNPTTVAGYGLTDVYTKTQIDTALALKANLAGANFTGPVYVPNVPVGNNSQLAVNSAFVQATLAALVASSPAALDTLNELAAALGNDPNFATTVTNLLAGKADKATTLAGYGITNAQPLDSDLTALAALVTVGFYVNTGVGSVAARSITAGSGVSVSNGDGVAGNPVISLSNSGVGAGSYSKVTVDALGRVTAGSNPTTLAGAGITDAFTKTESNTAIQTAIASLVNSSPAALDTLNELAAALGNDPSFATTMTNALAGKVAASDKAVQLDAETGTNDTKWMTPLRVFQAIGKVVKQATESAFGWAKVATQAQVDTGSDDATIVTPKKLLNGVASSNGVTSYRKTASWQDGGTIRSSGTAQTTSTGRVVVTLPLAFADTNYVITCSSQSAGAGFPGWSVEVNKGARTTSTFEVGTFTSSAASAANVPFQWTAEGKAP